MAIVADAGAPSPRVDPTLAGYDSTPVFGVPGYSRITVNGKDVLRITGGAGEASRVMAEGSDANIPIVLQPKGTGAVQAQFNDGTTAGGNARGGGASDWQTSRIAATQVASGANATIGGGRNNTASTQSSTVGGGQNNQAIGGTAATVGGGDTNAASGLGATVSGGRGNTANATDAWIPGGAFATTRGTVGKGAWSGGKAAADGDRQASELTLFRGTTDATPTVLTSNGIAPAANNQFIIANNSVGAILALVCARDGTSAGKLVQAYLINYRRDASAASVNVSAIQLGNVPAGTVTGWSIAFSGDTTNGALQATVTGAAATNIEWMCRLVAAELVF